MGIRNAIVHVDEKFVKVIVLKKKIIIVENICFYLDLLDHMSGDRKIISTLSAYLRGPIHGYLDLPLEGTQIFQKVQNHM